MLSGGLVLLALVAGVQAQGPCGMTPIAPNLNNKGVRDINNEIVGGVNAVPYSWPWQVLWCVGTNPSTCSLSCGGSVIDRNWVITAGHCVYGNLNAGSYSVKAGAFQYTESTASVQQVRVSQIYLHPNYGQTPVNDIALIRLATPLSYTNQVQPVCLPTVDSTQTTPPSTAWVTGWGTTTSGGQVSPQLKQVNVPFVSYTSCRNSYGTSINDNLMTCAGIAGKDSCQGDSGGPMVAQSNNGSWFEYGIVSWGRGCALAGYPGVYARMSAFCSWIQSTTNGDVNCARPT